MKKKTWIILTILIIFFFSFIVFLLVNNKKVKFNIEDTEFNMLNENNFNSVEVKEVCLDCETLEYKESVIINDYDKALDLIKVVHKSEKKEINIEDGLGFPEKMAIIMYEKEIDEISYVYAITISAIDPKHGWVYISEENKYYSCEFTDIDIIKYIDDLYNMEV